MPSLSSISASYRRLKDVNQGIRALDLRLAWTDIATTTATAVILIPGLGFDSGSFFYIRHYALTLLHFTPVDATFDPRVWVGVETKLSWSGINGSLTASF